MEKEISDHVAGIRAEKFRRNVRQAETVPDAFYGTIFAGEGSRRREPDETRIPEIEYIKYEIAKIALPSIYRLAKIKIKFLPELEVISGSGVINSSILFFSIFSNLKRHNADNPWKN